MRASASLLRALFGNSVTNRRSNAATSVVAFRKSHATSSRAGAGVGDGAASFGVAATAEGCDGGATVGPATAVPLFAILERTVAIAVLSPSLCPS